MVVPPTLHKVGEQRMASQELSAWVKYWLSWLQGILGPHMGNIAFEAQQDQMGRDISSLQILTNEAKLLGVKASKAKHQDLAMRCIVVSTAWYKRLKVDWIFGEVTLLLERLEEAQEDHLKEDLIYQIAGAIGNMLSALGVDIEIVAQLHTQIVEALKAE